MSKETEGTSNISEQAKQAVTNLRDSIPSTDTPQARIGGSYSPDIGGSVPEQAKQAVTNLRDSIPSTDTPQARTGESYSPDKNCPPGNKHGKAEIYR